MFSQDIFGLHDDGFDESNDELVIAQNIFYGNVAGVASSGSKPDKLAIILPCSNSEKSAVTIQASSDDLCHKDVDHTELYRVSRAQSSMDASISDDRIRHDVHPKRIKLSVNELCSFKPFLDESVATSIPMKQVVYGMYSPAPHSSGQILMCHVVESSGDALTSSCYLLKENLELDGERNVGDCLAPNSSLSGSDGSEVKQIVACQSMASPISQESSATKLLVSRSPRLTEKRSTVATCRYENYNLRLTGNDTKHLSAVLRSKAYQLLETTGWSTENQVRNDGRNRFIYRSPEGRRFRTLSEVWYFVGSRLFAHKNSEMVLDDKEWTDITTFCSDLYDTLKYIEDKKDDWKSRCALTCMWRLLDPFVNVILVNRKLIALKTGNAVKVNRSNEFNMDGVNSGNADVDGNVNMPDERFICDSSLAFDADETHKKSIYVSEGNDMCLLRTIDKEENHCEETYTDENMHITSNQLSADLVSGRLCDTSLENADTNMIFKQSETVSPHQGSSMSSPSCDKFNVESSSQGNAKDAPVCSIEEGAEPLQPHAEVNLKEKTEDKSKKFPVVELCEFCQAEEGDVLLRDDGSHQSKLADIRQWSIEAPEKKKKKTGKKPRIKKPRIEKPRPIKNQNALCLEEPNPDTNADAKKKSMKPKKRAYIKKRTKRCQLEDGDLLVSAIIKKKSVRRGKNKLGPKPKKFKSKSRKKRKSKKGGCRLRLRGLEKGGKNFTERWTLISERTILSWLISTEIISINEAIQYRDPKDDSVVKDGLVSREGILCRCCNENFSVSEFKIHAGFNQNRPCLNLFMGSGRSYTLSQLQAWSDEYKIRKGNTLSVPVDESDKNDDSCGICADVGELLCCDNCPSTFHQSCLSAEEIPEGNWYCTHCTCQVCGQLADDKDNSSSDFALRCSQCEKKYHKACLMEKDMNKDEVSPWFCGVSCEEVYIGLQSRIGLSTQIGDGYSWTLLRCIHDDQKVSSAQRFALKAECNAKLAVAATIMEECFLSMVDPRTGIDMIPQVVYNWGSEFARLDYHGFYTAVLEKNDVLISIASVRVHGAALAEMPLIATCSKYRRQGMCRRLLNSVEEMLRSLKVEKLVIAAISDLVETWTVGFGFVPMEEDEKQNLSKINMMVFPGTIMLKKTIFVKAEQEVSCVNRADHSLDEMAGELKVKLIGPLNRNSDETQNRVEHSEMESELLKSFSSFEAEDVETNLEGSWQEKDGFDHSNSTRAAQGIEIVQDNNIGTGETLIEESPMKPLEVAECMDKTCEALAEDTQLQEASEEMNCTDRLFEKAETTGDGSNTNQDEITNKSVNLESAVVPEDVAEGTENACACRTRENVTSNVSDVKEAGEGANRQFEKAETASDGSNTNQDEITNKSVNLESVVVPEDVAEGTENACACRTRENVTSNVSDMKEAREGANHQFEKSETSCNGTHGNNTYQEELMEANLEPLVDPEEVAEVTEQDDPSKMTEHVTSDLDEAKEGAEDGKDLNLEPLVHPEEVAEVTEQNDPSKMTENMTSNLDEAKEGAEDGEDLNIRDHADCNCVKIETANDGSNTNHKEINIESMSLEPMVDHEEVTEGMKIDSPRIIMKNVTSNTGEVKEASKGGKGMYIWDYWDACVEELEPSDEPIVANETVSNGESCCINVAEKPLSLVEESQEGNVLP